MAMQGKIYAMNSQRGMVAIATKNQGFTIIELLSNEEFELGDEMSWQNDTGLGGQTYLNMTKKNKMDVFVQNHWVPENQLRQQLLVD